MQSKTQPKSGKSDQHNIFCEEEGKLPGQTSSEMEMGMYYTRENVFNMSVTWEYITVKDHKIKMQVDTSADSTVISSLICTELGKPQLNGKVRRLEAYDGHQLTLLGSLTCDVEWNGSKYRQQQLAVVQSDKKFGLLGRDILPQEGINAVSDERLPAVKGYKAHVKLIPGSRPMFCKARKIPLPLQDRVKVKLETMVRQGILEPVQPGGVTNASPVVWQRKKNGALRLCVDLKVHINGKVMDEDYPIPDMETIFHNLHGASYFGKIDLSDAYYQIELDEDAKEICTINTSQGLFKMCRLPQGLKNSSSIFENCIESTLKGIKGVVIFQDGVLVYGTIKDQYEKRILAVKSRLREKNFTINEKKSNSKPVSSVSFLGYSVSKEGIAPDPKHVEKIKNAKPPSNMKQLESFVGLANFYGRMIPNFATKMLPLNEIRKEEFRWDKEEQNAFENIKNELCANPHVQLYSLTKEATVTTDASEKAIGGVLSQEGHPVIYVSRKLSQAEQNYSNIEREALAIVFVVTRLKQFLLGRRFTLQTEHKPLKYLFAPDEEIPKTASARITRWAIALMGFDFELKYTPGEQIPHADALSRLDFDDDDDNDRVCFALDNIYFVQSDLVTQSDIKTELGSNRLIQDVIKRIKSGIWKQCSESEKGFEQQKDALTIHNGIIFRGVMPFIPPKLRPMVMAKAHETHTGKNATETAIRMMAWWPGIGQDVLRYVSKCKECQENRPSLGKTVSTWPEAEVWERLHMDWGYVKDQGNILVIVNAGSGWIEAFPAGNRTSQTVKVYLSQIFARFGIPRTLVSDNGPEFVSSDLK